MFCTAKLQRGLSWAGIQQHLPTGRLSQGGPPVDPADFAGNLGGCL